MKNKLGMSFVISHKSSPDLEKQIEIFSNAGFDSLFLSYGSVTELSYITKLKKCCQKNNIELEAIHGFSNYLDGVWTGNFEDSKNYIISTKYAINHCGENGIKKLVLHPINESKDNLDNAINIFLILEEYAKSHNVLICYENSKNQKRFEEFMLHEHINCGFCYDSGHEICYTPNAEFIKKFGSELVYTHLHDNFMNGIDMHLLPYNGKGNWNRIAKNLAEVDYKGTLNLELSCYYNEQYNLMSFEDFVLKAYISAKKIRDSLKI